MENSCGGTGCNTPEHEKRLGTDFVRISIDLDRGIVYVPEKVNIGSLVHALEEVIGEDWHEFDLDTSPIYGIKWTTTVAN
jgi:hypothetical protein